MSLEKPKNGGSLLLPGIAVLTSVVTGMIAITRPIQIQMEDLGKRLERVESRTTHSLKQLDDKLQIEIAGQARLSDSQTVALRDIQKEIEIRAGSNAQKIVGNEVKIAILEERIRNVGKKD